MLSISTSLASSSVTLVYAVSHQVEGVDGSESSLDKDDVLKIYPKSVSGIEHRLTPEVRGHAVGRVCM